MITFVTHMRVVPEHQRAFEAAVGEMTANVRAHEPGTVYYALSKSVEDPEAYMVIEVYRDEAAVEAHARTDYIRTSLARTTPLVAGGTFDCKRYAAP